MYKQYKSFGDPILKTHCPACFPPNLAIMLAAALLAFLPTQSNAQVKYSNEFLAIGAGARAMAMSNAQVAFVNDATAGYWNPAGLLEIKDKYAFSIMHASYFAGIANYDYAAFATPVDETSRIGVSLIRFGIDDIPDTRFLFDADGKLNYDNVRSFSAADYALIFSYAKRFPLLKDIKFGGNFKIIHRNVGVFANAWGFGLDVGAQMQHRKWLFGLVGRDISGTYNAWTFNPETFYDVFAQTGNTIPDNSIEVTVPRLIAGVARDFVLLRQQETPLLNLLVSTGFDMTFDGQRNTLVRNRTFSLDPHLGMELGYRNTVFLRGGIGNFQQIKNFDSSLFWSYQPNFGVGARIKNIYVDYALTNLGGQAEALYSNVFSLRFGMGKSLNTKPRYGYDR